MKKILLALVLISFLAVLFTPVIASAQITPQECCKLRRDIKYDTELYAKGDVVGPSRGICDVAITKTTKDWGAICLLNTIHRITDLIFLILMAIAVIMVLVGAIMFMTAAGSETQTKMARNILTYAVVGIIIALLARVIPAIVKMVV